MTTSSASFRGTMPETIFLEPEHYAQATVVSRTIFDSDQQWQTYIGVLACQGVTDWLEQHRSNLQITVDSDDSTGTCTILSCAAQASPFRLAVVAVDQILEGLIQLPASLMAHSVHHYLFVEVSDDRQELTLLGVLTSERLQKVLASLPLTSDQSFEIPLSAIDPEPGHLLNDYAFTVLAPIEAQQPTVVAQPSLEDTRLQDWLTATIADGWQLLTDLINPTASLSWSTRNRLNTGQSRAKRIIFGPDQPQLLLVMGVEQEEEAKLKISVQLHPTNVQETLPEAVTLQLHSQTGKEIQRVQSESQDSYIQLRPFRVSPLTAFRVSIALSGFSWSETFVDSA